ncbi:hypothetical protein AAFF_G00136930 [Aldrovandia affinis]|uniref:Uncharacterized protein n=1 Tax=Aldrovandia affinis TaxID=143900 RepID=A0AAD7TBM2_9TELE|nr:hypothetical protein AAFF_G00136930 [Aldrovandia affinis]
MCASVCSTEQGAVSSWPSGGCGRSDTRHERSQSAPRLARRTEPHQRVTVSRQGVNDGICLSVTVSRLLSEVASPATLLQKLVSGYQTGENIHMCPIRGAAYCEGGGLTTRWCGRRGRDKNGDLPPHSLLPRPQGQVNHF